MSEPEEHTVSGKITRIGSGEDNIPRIIIQSTEESLRGFPCWAILEEVEITFKPKPVEPR